jgi:hypothetical protein
MTVFLQVGREAVYIVRAVVNHEKVVHPFFQVMVYPFMEDVPFVLENGEHTRVLLGRFHIVIVFATER